MYLQAFAEHGVIQMALVAFHWQLLDTLCISVFVFAHCPYRGYSILAFWLNSNFSVCSVWALLLSKLLPEYSHLLQSWK